MRRWYLEEGRQFPFPDYLRKGRNTLLRRAGPPKGDLGEQKLDKTFDPLPEDRKLKGIPMKVYNKFCSMSIKQVDIGDENHEDIIETSFVQHSLANLGTLFLRRSEIDLKWYLPKGKDRTPVVKKSVQLPPILIISCGRAQTGLLDLSRAMEGNKNYIQVVIIRPEERDEYLRTALAHPPLDVFVMRNSEHKTIGEARMASKKFGEMITERTGMKFVFTLDDNVLFWNGVTLINDPCQLFETEADHRISQNSDISLFNVLSHFSSDSFQRVDKFSLLGFSSFTKGVRKRKSAYRRKHVHCAVLLNLTRLKEVNFNPKAWAMEDIDFNWKTNALSDKNPEQGVIVKCMRYVAYKKRMTMGGVVPSEVPIDLDEVIRVNGATSPLNEEPSQDGYKEIEQEQEPSELERIMAENKILKMENSRLRIELAEKDTCPPTSPNPEELNRKRAAGLEMSQDHQELRKGSTLGQLYGRKRQHIAKKKRSRKM